ncbi:MAG: excisionase [Gammaproteobacteria bacterium]
MSSAPQHVGRVQAIAAVWITLAKYCELSGETPAAVRSRRQKGIWLDGKHTQVRDRRIWVNAEAAQRWVATGA